MQNTISQEHTNTGFTLSELDNSHPVEQSYGQSTDVPTELIAHTHVRDIVFGVAVTLVLMLLYVVIKDTFSCGLIRKRFSPTAADRAGFWLFGLLMFTTIMILLLLLFPDVFVGPERIVAIISLPVLCSVMVAQSSRGSHRR